MRVCQIGRAPNRGKEGVAVPVDRGVTLAGVTPGLRRLAWLIEVRGLADRSEGSGQ